MNETSRVNGWESARTLLAALASGETTSVQLLDMYLDRISTDSWVNAVVTVDVTRARLEAEEADRERAAGLLRGPLHGLPVTVKDDLLVEGMTATYGAFENSNFIADEDAPLVANLKRAGAIVFGKTNLPRLAGDGQTYNELFGTTVNPWNADYTCGGSSGGSAAALAAGMSALELGSDMGGSIRIPAAWCGVYGLKPTWGVLPSGGSAPVPGEKSDLIGRLPVEIAMHGPLARSADDLGIALRVLGDISPEDGRFEQVEERLSLSDVRVDAWLSEQDFATERETLSVLEQFCDDLGKSGVSIHRDSRPPFDFQRMEFLFETMFMAQKAASLSDADLEWLVEYLKSRETDWELAGIHRRALTLSHREWLWLDNERQELREVWGDYFADGRILVTPTAVTTAIVHDHTEPAHERTTMIDGREIIHRPELTRWCGIASVAHLPALSIPVGTTATGLPVGAQLIGPEFSDFRLVEIASEFSQVSGGFKPPAYAMQG